MILRQLLLLFQLTARLFLLHQLENEYEHQPPPLDFGSILQICQAITVNMVNSLIHLKRFYKYLKLRKFMVVCMYEKLFLHIQHVIESSLMK